MPLIGSDRDKRREATISSVQKQFKPCIPQPFNMPGDIFRKKAQDKFSQQLQEQQQKIRRDAEFRANPVPSFYPPTYAKQIKDLEITSDQLDQCCPNHIRLATESRAQERAQYEEYKRRKQEELDFLKQIEEDQRQKLEQEEIRLERKASEFKANPFNNVQQEIHRVEPKPVTQAITPVVLKRVPSGKKK
ncbi:Conserved_hypothetical protein [Hexamita inflata]|uniref:TPX2 C-terminal domain-containing protein n=1 Tax=Hexamita inflata TaxID=28002 RepID=A0ABP1GDV9_9EUKA